MQSCADLFPMRRPAINIALVVAIILVLACSFAARAQTSKPTLEDEADGANWPAIGRTYGESHYSPLNQINDGNVGRLRLAAFTDLPAVVSAVTAPLAVDGVVYFSIGLSIVHAVDARTGTILWTYDPGVAAAAGQKLRPAWGTRGIAYWNGNIYVCTQDGRLIALDAKKGSLVWSVLTTKPNDGRFITGAPRAFNGKIIVGHAGGDAAPTRGYVTTYDAASGRKLWRFYTVPAEAGSFDDKSIEWAAKTWSGWRGELGGGGTVWNAITYDARFNRIYIGTGNAEPWNPRIRGKGGDNLFVCSIVALDASSGKYIWHYQINPGDAWDFDAAMEMELTDLPIHGKRLPVLLQAPKNGFFYIIDRRNGKLLSAEKFGRVNWAARIDLKSGRPVENPDARYDEQPYLVYPGPGGAHNIQAMGYNPISGLAYIPRREQGWVYSQIGVEPKHWQPLPGMVVNPGLGAPPVTPVAPPGHSDLLAWDPLKQKPVWTVATPGAAGGGVATTAGNLVFQGQLDGRFQAYAADSGKLLWSFEAQNGILGQPITYLVNGVQYITVIAGLGGANGAVNGAPFGWDYHAQKRRVLTFSLDGAATLPALVPFKLQTVDDPAFVVDAGAASVGAGIYNAHCLGCHGPGVKAGGAAPDLRASSIALSKAAFRNVVRDGALVPRGMPRFEEFSDAQIDGLMHYIRSEQRMQSPQTPLPPSR